MIVNREELSDVFGVAMTTVDVWKKEGCPVAQQGGRGQSYKFDTADVHKWLVRRALEEKRRRGNRFGGGEETDDDEGDMTIDRAKLRHESAKARKAELELAEQMELVVPVAKIGKIVTEEIANARARLLAVPIKARPDVQMIVETNDKTKKIVAIIESRIREALTEIKSYGDPEA